MEQVQTTCLDCGWKGPWRWWCGRDNARAASLGCASMFGKTCEEHAAVSRGGHMCKRPRKVA